MLAFLILAFAQPFLPSTKDFNKPTELVIYLDNSFSMQARGSNGSLLNEAKQQLLNYLPEEDKFTLFTNDRTFTNVSKSTITTDLIDLGYSNNQISYDAAYLKALQLFNKEQQSIKNLIFISDFQQKEEANFPPSDSLVRFSSIQLKAQNRNNISIDSVYFESQSNKRDIQVVLSNYGDPVDNVAISLYNEDQLVTKVSTAVDKTTTVQFSLANEDNFKGKLDILDNGLVYDNRFYFNIEQSEKINILSINEISDLFLRKIFTKDEFNYTAFEVEAINYSQIAEQNLVVLNHLDILPDVLINTLLDFHENGGSILIIPSDEMIPATYNQLLEKLKEPIYVERISDSKKVTEIIFAHPLLTEAFYAEVTNFQYPEVQSFYKRANSLNAIYKLEDGNAFLTGHNRVYSFSADLSISNSNFLQSPLIVPALYNMAKQSLIPPELYYTIGNDNKIIITESLGAEDIINLRNNAYSSIPRQRVYGKFVEIQTIDEPDTDGHYSLDFKDKSLRQLSYNYKRDESSLLYLDLSQQTEITTWNDLSEAIQDIKTATNVKALWKWFVIFALVLLLLEMLILKYFK